MTILSKDYVLGIVGETTVTSSPGLPATDEYWASIPADTSTDATITTAAIEETPGYIRPATWAEVKSIWYWLTEDCAVSQQILTAVMTTQTMGAIFKSFQYPKAVQIPGEPLQVYYVHIAIQNIEGFGVGFCAVTGDLTNTYVVTGPNPVYDPTFEYTPGMLEGC